jgi:tRNA-uridine 2-sulfurtransferase
MKSNGKKVFVGLSGGVDSSVSAAVLKDQGYGVTGVFIKVWHPDFLPCDWKQERRDAMRVCAELDIPFLTFDFEKEYKHHVVDYMIAEYRAGRTPNPDVMCNKDIKFGSFLEKARLLGADYIATGHYAQIKSAQTKGTRDANDEQQLFESTDKAKDQSYFLWTLGQEALKHSLFPVGDLNKKTEVRALAKKYGLHTSTKKDSQGLCFLGKVNMRDFLQHYIPQKPGKVLNEAGKTIGTHEGALFYTIGQRHGFTIIEKTPIDRPLYVSAKDVEANTITVSEKEKTQASVAEATTVRLKNCNWIGSFPAKTKLSARIRYHQIPQACTFKKGEKSKPEKAEITFAEPQDAALGQSVVLYDDERCLGGGIIEQVS